MSDDRLNLLFLSPFPPSPAAFGAQRRMEGLMSALSRRHRITAVSLVGSDFDAGASERAMRAYCEEVVLVPARQDRGLSKRFLQLQSLVSPRSFERTHATVPALQVALDALLRRRAFHVVTVEFPFLSHLRLRQAPAGSPPPLVVLDEHNVEYDLARQSRDASRGALRRLHHAVNWRKILSEELAAWRGCDGVAFTSTDDAERARELHAGTPFAVIPNAVDVEHFRPRPDLPPPDGRTLVFCGTMRYFPNLDGIQYFLSEIWPGLAQRHPQARLKLIGPNPTPEVLRHQGPRVEVTGLVEDLRPHLAQAAAVIVPLRVGGGTRFKILEAMAMGRPVVSTTLGAEGIAATQGEDILLADDPAAFAAAAGRLLDDAVAADRLGASGRTLVERRYSWEAAAQAYQGFLHQLLGRA
jgi:glycosyltransferase involved in cell wall biosynthesis